MSSPQPNIPLELRPDHPEPAHPSRKTLIWETLVSVCLIAVGAAMAYGAVGIPSEAGYGGVGANFLPWVVSIALMVCGAILLWHARTGGYREMEEVEGEESPDWINFVWVSAGLLLNAGLIEHLGFIISCTLCYLLAVQGLRRASGQDASSVRVWAVDALTGVLISAPVFWAFTKFLAINLPGLTQTGWL